MTTVQIAYEVTAETVSRIAEHLDNVARRDINWNGAEFNIERDDFTCIPDDESPEAVILLGEIQEIIEGEV